MKDFRNTKVHVPTPEISRKVQEEMFKKGFRWAIGERTVQHTYHKFLYFWDDKYICYNSGQEYFNKHLFPEVKCEDIIGPQLPFQVGDKVCAFGLDGTVTDFDQTAKYGLTVRWDNCDEECDEFMNDGRFYDYHKEPSLVLVERPVKKVKKSFWLWADENGEVTDLVADEDGNSPSFAHKYNMEKMTKIPGTKVTLEVAVNS